MSLIVPDLPTLWPGRNRSRSCELPRLTAIARPYGHVAGTPADRRLLLHDGAMQTSGTRPGPWVSYRSGPGGKDHLPPDVRAEVERREASRKERQGRQLCEVHVLVYEDGAEPYVTFTSDAVLDVESDASEISAAVARARDCLVTWR